MAIGESQAHLCPDGLRVGRRAFEHHTQARPGTTIGPENGGSVDLRHHHIDPSIVVEVSQGRGPLFAIDANAGNRGVYGLETSVATSPQPESAARVVARIFRKEVRTILTEKNVLKPIAIDVGDIH